jgi:hypothetical protein
MDPSSRIITELPLRELWDEFGPVVATEVRDLSVAEIAGLLRGGNVRFVVADVGSKPAWIPPAETFRFWKEEVKPHLAEPGLRASLPDFPEEYCYFASEWRDNRGFPIIVLQRRH